RPPAGDGTATPPPGRSTVDLGGAPHGLWYVPRTPARRLVVLLHGAGGTAADALRLLLPYADERGLTLFAPQSAEVTWDVIGAGYGPDVTRVQHGLDRVLGACPVPAVAIGGFSDGASYALSLGLANGDVFDAVLAFSPGFAAPAGRAGAPALYVSHGRADRVLPVDRCSRRLVPALRDAGYRVAYDEFDGGHEVPAAVAGRALDWLAAR
ncbi:alpha/beta hydrolase, partial [Spirilliplanes yamanashiensis]